MNLFIDTSNNKLIIILEQNNQIIDHLFLDNQTRISDIALEKLHDFLKQNNLTIKDIKDFYLTVGPGSYTGVRVAVTIIKTLKTIDNSINVYTISSLAFQAGAKSAISLLDARGNKFYMGIYKNKECIIVDQLIPTDYLENFTDEFQGFDVLKDYNGIDFNENFLNLKANFKLVNDIEEIEPQYIKHFI
ncbi:tRNA (adenosine(37)-N6)-threonylcarbamoyltransferase complex dimerization subunit type 1 TsaB [Spiroplasma culicicola]|uniref:Glycoprotease n=1 Tax=Spiroplasma culicicola AES-1 TaxID=1276246 RepID=W6AFR0_9MOLU|nr:tRNA (adenosine(37)-N6)-threonylcarbamoyltransferase complex dimerization subunit type 1 TsaB [Spiroplasma culicicola]AHI52544.1 glycoprotease [Spiroplasma culicicola AES-1]